jgi:hypothetical protein
MSKLIKKYSFVSTSYYADGDWKSFYILHSGMTENDVLNIKKYADEYNRLWDECYKQERENANNMVCMDLRTDLVANLRRPIDIEQGIYHSIKDYHQMWLDKDLIIEHFEIED